MMMAFMALGFATVSTSCSSDDDELAPATDNSAILGDWGVVTTNANTSDVEWIGEMVFSSNGSYTVKADTPQFGTWTMNGKNIEFSNGTEKIVNTIKQQDATTMVLEYTQDGERYTMLMKRMEGQATVKNLVGTWKAGKPSIINPDDSDLTIEVEDLIFNADGTCYSDGTMGQWQLNGQTITISTEDGEMTGVVKNYNTIEITVEFDIEGTKFMLSMLRIK